ARKIPGGDAGLRRFACEVHLDERRNREATRRRFGVERVDELADAVDDLRLVRLQMPDEVPTECVAVLRVLRLEVLRAVLADDVDACVRENAHVGKRHVLRRRDDGHSGTDLRADAFVTLANALRRYTQSLPAVQ